MDNLTMKELQALYEYISKLDPNTEEYRAAVDAIVLLEKVQLDKDKLAIQQDENAKKMENEQITKEEELALQKKNSLWTSVLKGAEIVSQILVIGGVGLAACFSEETRILSKTIFGLFMKCLPKH